MHQKISRKINPSEIIPEGKSRHSASKEVEQTAEGWVDTGGGFTNWLPVFVLDRGVIDCCLLADALWISLTVQFGEKFFFIERIAVS